MKTKLPLIAAITGSLCATGSAFTLDFLSVPTGTPIPPSLIVNVPGYGDVRFDPVGGSTLIVDDRFENDSPGQTSSPLNFDPGDSVVITFLGSEPVDVDFDWWVNAGEFFIASPSSAKEYTVTLNSIVAPNSNSGAGLYQIGFTQVPEPSASLLGALGAALLVLRRKR